MARRSWKWTRKYPVDAQVVGKVIDSLPEKSAEELVRAARRKTSPVQSLFEWNQTKAAQEYRLLQARLIINSLECEIISVDSKPTYVKAFIKRSGDSSQYVNVEKADDDDLKDAEAECIRHMERFKKRWSDLELVGSVIAEMNAAKLASKRKRRKAA